MAEKFYIRSRATGAVIFETEIAAEYAERAYGVRLGLAVKAAYESGANMSDADLRGADLDDADLRGAYLRGAKIVRIVARACRLDGYEFIAFETDMGIIIRAGCRTMSPVEFRLHVANEYPGTEKAEETLAIIDFIEARAAIAKAEK